MIRQRSGHIVNTASLAGLVAAPGSASYTATKHAVVGISKVLRVEAKRHAITVSVLCPGAIRTPILTFGKYGRYKGVSDEQLLKFWEPFRPMAPEKFAERALRAVLRGDAIIVVPAWWKAPWYLDRPLRPYRCGLQDSRSSAYVNCSPPHRDPLLLRPRRRLGGRADRLSLPSPRPRRRQCLLPREHRGGLHVGRLDTVLGQ